MPNKTYSYSITLDTEGPHVVASDSFTTPAAPPDDGQTHTGTVLPRWNLVTLLYVPPGNQSQTSYGDGASTGSTFSNASSFKGALTIQFTSSYVNVGGSVGAGTGSSSSDTETETYTAGKGLKATKDLLDHGQDTFVLWLNPEMQFTGTSQKVNVTLATRNGEDPEIVLLTAAELQDPSTVPPSLYAAVPDLQALLADDEDRRNILAQDPFMNPSFDPSTASRFSKVGHYLMQGPAMAGLPTTFTPLTVGDQQSHSDTSTVSQNASFNFSAGAGFSFFVEVSMKVGVKLDWDWSTSKAQTTGTSTQIATQLGTSTAAYSDYVDVYVDQLYKSFAFVSQQSQRPPMTQMPGAPPVPQYYVTVERSGGGTVLAAAGDSVTMSNASLACGSNCTSPYNQGQKVTLQATPNDGWTFAGWSGACSGTSPTCSVVVNGETLAYANFARATTSSALHTLTLNIVPDPSCQLGDASGTVDTSPSFLNCTMIGGNQQTCTAQFGAGAIVDLWPLAIDTTTFTGFSGDCSGTGTCSLMMNRDHAVTATYCGLLR